MSPLLIVLAVWLGSAMVMIVARAVGQTDAGYGVIETCLIRLRTLSAVARFTRPNGNRRFGDVVHRHLRD